MFVLEVTKLTFMINFPSNSNNLHHYHVKIGELTPKNLGKAPSGKDREERSQLKSEICILRWNNY